MRVSGERALIAGRRLRGPGSSSVLPVHASLALRLEFPGRLAVRCGICTPLGVVSSGARGGWHRLPLSARGPAGALAALAMRGVPGTRLGRARVRRQGSDR
jgi:hypothetical protein